MKTKVASIYSIMWEKVPYYVGEVQTFRPLSLVLLRNMCIQYFSNHLLEKQLSQQEY